MAIVGNISSPSLSSLHHGQGGLHHGSTETPVGLRSLASIGSGLRTGVTVVQRATVTASELSEARERASEALAEQARLEREHAAAHDESVAADLQPATPNAAPPTAAAPAQPDAAEVKRTVDAAVVAGSAGDVAPRGAFVDLSV
jgi:hypothetical protein